MNADLVSNDRAVASGDVAKRARMHQGWRALEGLHQVRLDGFLQDDGH